MKIKTNVRAGAGANSNSAAKAGGVGGHSSQANNTVVFYIPPVSRCVGI